MHCTYSQLKTKILLYWYYHLPKINKTLGLYDKYNNGRVSFIDFKSNDVIVIWITYKAITKAYRIY